MISVEQSQRIFELVVQPLKTVCAWCRCTIAEGGRPISYGICPTCAEQFKNGGAR